MTEHPDHSGWATFSGCRRYRYRLRRTWNSRGPHPFGPRNEAAWMVSILDTWHSNGHKKHDKSVNMIVCAWGRHGKFQDADRKAKLLIAQTGWNEHAFCLAENRDGTPRHPLYVKMDQELMPLDFTGTGWIE